ncbi:MAG: outer membrane lipoprotein-sorting protein [Bdellovibrionaceae bacterium]|jgi:outer membrane lipoprotein-sorting protein|nr:outer membrane lipoprotein-sorting protein [Pseudobdellovibrionaceae bacterium]
MKNIIKLLAGILVLASLGSLNAETGEEKGYNLSYQSEIFNNGFKGESTVMEMTLINAHGDRVVRKMTSKIKETEGDGDKSITEFLWPADVKGTKMLTWSHKSKNDDQWLYLPALKRVKRISSRSKTGSFMGSEFSYEDLGSQEVEKFKFKFLADEKVNARDTWKIERIPQDKKSGYSRQVVWLDKEYQSPVKIEYYDRKSELLKTGEFSDYSKYGKWFRASTLKMENHQTKKISIINWSKRKLSVQFSDRDFHKKKLK